MMKAFADQRKAKPVFRRHAPPARVDQAGRPCTAQRVQVREILDSSRPQFKLTIGAPNDVYEQEADRVADQVMCNQPTTDGCKESATSVSSNSSGVRGNLDSDTKSFMEARFAANFDQVRVHTDRQASKAAVALGARAFATGPDIYFARGEYRPHNRSGRLLLAHELTHVVQQGYVRPMVQRQATGISGVEVSQERPTPTGDNIAPVVAEADKGTRKAIEVLEKALKAADEALAEKTFPEDKLARIRVQAAKLRPMLTAYRKVERGEPPDTGLTLDFDPERDQIDEGDADVLARGDFEESGPVVTASPQVFASRTEHDLVSLRVEGVDVQRFVCGGLCIGGAIALGALLVSGCSGKKKKKKPKATLKRTVTVQPTNKSCGGFTMAARWSLNNADASTNGFVVQKLTFDLLREKCAGGRNDFPKTYWEGWQVRSGVIYIGTSRGHHSADTFSVAPTPDHKGDTYEEGKAKFIEGYTAPLSWGHVPEALSLPSTEDKAKVPGWSDSGTLDRWIGVRNFDCCNQTDLGDFYHQK